MSTLTCAEAVFRQELPSRMTMAIPAIGKILFMIFMIRDLCGCQLVYSIVCVIYERFLCHRGCTNRGFRNIYDFFIHERCETCHTSSSMACLYRELLTFYLIFPDVVLLF